MTTIEYNKIYNCDCLELSKKIEDNTIDLIYIDPPFFTQETMRSSNKEYAFDDKWKDIDDYLNFLYVRFLEFKRILKSTGSIFVHCDRNASAYIKCILDKVFGFECFESEIIWIYKRWSNAKKGLLNSHQTIYFYSKTKDFKFNKILTEYSTTTNLDQILQARVRTKDGKSTYQKDAEGNVVNVNQKKGVPLSDVWDIPFLNPKAKERVNYPTQKPIELLERIIKLTTDENDVVFDGFIGSGTTAVASMICQRKFIGCDISKQATDLAIKRLTNPIKSESILLKKGYEAYDSKTQEIKRYLQFFNAKVVQRNKYIDGIMSGENSELVPIKILTKEEDFNNVLKGLCDATKKRNLSKGILICDRKGTIKFNDIEIILFENYNLLI